MLIDKRFDTINNREEFEHWEPDLIEGVNYCGIILTIKKILKYCLWNIYQLERRQKV